MHHKAASYYQCMLVCLVGFSLSCQRVFCGPRTQLVNITCAHQPQHNSSIYVPNAFATVESIFNQIRTSGFGFAVTGSGPDASYGLAQCYGDLSSNDCLLCYAEARTNVPQCHPSKGARIFLDGCYLRHDNYSFFEDYKGPNDHIVCGNATKSLTFGDSAKKALSTALSIAPNNAGYARSQAAIRGTNGSAYVLANCWRTLNASSCRLCLENATASLQRCLPHSEGRALNTGCFVRYSDQDFLNPDPGNRGSRGIITIIVVSAVTALVILGVAVIIGIHIWKRRYIQKKRRGSNDAQNLVKTLNDSSLNFKYSTLEKATGSFDEANKLGQGGYGSVYKGVLPDGREIAVKRLFFNNKHRARDFYNEVNLISSVEHKNLVRLLGCSCSGPESLLVYEFLPNKSLDRFIFDQNKGKALTWERRYNIIIGMAAGLVYLHENSSNEIVHRDIKASNILLDSRFHAKIADFGLARSFQEDKSHITTAIAGTFGYMAPEYVARGHLTKKADVYSFGVLVLEIVTGRQNNWNETSGDLDGLVTLTWRKFQAGTVDELYDPNLMLDNHHNSNIKDEIFRIVHVGLLCTQEIPLLRPTMAKALQMIVTEEDLPAPAKPPFMDEKTMELNGACEVPWYPLNADLSRSVATVTHSSFHPR